MSSKPWEKDWGPAKLKPWEKDWGPVEPTEKVVDVQKITRGERAALKNLISNSPELQEEYLKRRGYELKTVDGELPSGELKVRKPGEVEWGVVDPAGFDLQDVTDVAGDVIEGLLVAAGVGAGTAAGGVPGAVAGGVAASTAAEAGRQSLAQLLGVVQPGKGDLSELGAAGAKGAISGLLPSAVAKTFPSKAALGSKLTALQEELSGLYAKLDKTLFPQHKTTVINKVISSVQAKQPFSDPRIEAAVKEELEGWLSNTPKLGASQRWGLSRGLDQRAQSLVRSGGDEDLVRALQAGAQSLRTELYSAAEASGVAGLVPKSRLYTKISEKAAQGPGILSRATEALIGGGGKRAGGILVGAASEIPGRGKVGMGAFATKSFLDILEEAQRAQKQ